VVVATSASRLAFFRRQILERVCQGDDGKDGKRPFATLKHKHIRILRDEMADRPGAANAW
jgi:hypothetical protein